MLIASHVLLFLRGTHIVPEVSITVRLMYDAQAFYLVQLVLQGPLHLVVAESSWLLLLDRLQLLDLICARVTALVFAGRPRLRVARR